MAAMPFMPNFSWLRTFRVLRPLRSLTKFKGLKVLVTSLLMALPALGSVFLLFVFFFALFGILSVQIWAGAQHGRCRNTLYPVMLPDDMVFPPNASYIDTVVNNASLYRCAPDVDMNGTVATSWTTPRHCFWPISTEDVFLCGGGRECESGKTCGSNFDNFGRPRFAYDAANKIDAATYIRDLNWGYTVFDDFPTAILAIFQCITLEGWTGVMYQVKRRELERGGVVEERVRIVCTCMCMYRDEWSG